MSHSSTIAPRTNKKNDVKAQTELFHDGKPGSRLVPLAMTFEELLGRNDAPDETAEEIVQAVRQWRDTPSNLRLD